MSKESKEIREILNEITGIIEKTSINEAYSFGQKLIPEDEGENIDLGDDMSGNMPDNFKDQLPGTTRTEEPHKAVNIDKQIEAIRRLAIKILEDLSPLDNPEESKLVKNIWNSCDNFLIKDKLPKEQNNNAI